MLEELGSASVADASARLVIAVVWSEETRAAIVTDAVLPEVIRAMLQFTVPGVDSVQPTSDPAASKVTPAGSVSVTRTA